MKVWSTHGHETVERPDLHESGAGNTRAVWWFIAGLLSFLLLAALGLAGLYHWFGTRAPMGGPPLTPLEPALQVPPPPRLQTVPERDLKEMRAHENEALSTYGWVDQKAGTVRIPIERAMDMIAQRGLPARTPGGAVPTVPATGAGSGGPQTKGPSPQQPYTMPVRPQSLSNPPGAQERR